MPNTIDYDGFVAMLHAAGRQINDNHETLSRLDGFGGDGDHGSTMVRAMAQVEKAVAAASPGDMKALCNDIGWAIMGVDGGATGPLLGSLFMGMADAASDEIDSATLAAMFRAGLEGVRKRTRANVGDKTMLDALVPAVEAMSEAAANGADTVSCLRQACEAAQKGAEATKDMQARFGRAKNLGEKSVGEQDPGATYTSLIFKGPLKGIDSDA